MRFEIRPGQRPGWLIVLGIALATVWALGSNISLSFWPNQTRVTFLDVGQGDAAFIQTKAGHRLVIDGGPNNQLVGKLTARLPVFDEVIDAAFLTHGDLDHLNGLIYLINALPVRAVFYTDVYRDTERYQDFLDAMSEHKVPLYRLSQGATLNFGEATLKVLSPNNLLAGRILPKVNNTSLVLELQVGERRFLFPGDIEASIEATLANNPEPIDVLKVAHHGSKTSSSLDFLKAFEPALAIIEVGAGNTYGHPTEEVLGRLGAGRVWRTDLNGDITMETDGREIRVVVSKH